MRKILTSSMIAGAALLVAACGGETAVNNTVDANLTEDPMMDANATDMGMDTNMTMDANATTTTTDADANMTTTTTTTTETNAQ